jgi:NADPH:quinone reductase-like Zn-dependent oxidoreductase
MARRPPEEFGTAWSAVGRQALEAGGQEVVVGARRGNTGRMQALQFTSYGDPEVLSWADAPDPHAGAGQVRIAVRAASVNPIDWKLLSGAMSGGQPLTGTGYLGHDAAGVVDEVGPDVDDVSVGDDVFGRGRNTHAQYAVLDSWARKPPSVDWAVAAAAGVAGETGERALRLLGVQAGDTVFIDGGAGGVGAVAVQMALARGARVIASAGDANQDYLRELGAIPVRYGEGVADRVRAAAGGQVDAVFDVAGKTPVEQLTSLVSEPSGVLSIANFTAAQAGARVTGGGEDSRPMEALAQVAELLTQNKLVIKVQTFPFDRAAEAYRISQNGHVRGKLVLVP